MTRLVDPKPLEKVSHSCLFHGIVHHNACTFGLLKRRLCVKHREVLGLGASPSEEETRATIDGHHFWGGVPRFGSSRPLPKAKPGEK